MVAVEKTENRIYLDRKKHSDKECGVAVFAPGDADQALIVNTLLVLLC